jgi:hypothetical protein
MDDLGEWFSILGRMEKADTAHARSEVFEELAKQRDAFRAAIDRVEHLMRADIRGSRMPPS